MKCNKANGRTYRVFLKRIGTIRESNRHNRKSTIISSQLPAAKWYEVIGESTVADAILDRMVQTAHRLELKGESLRKK